MATYRDLELPDATDPPDGPGAFLSLAQSLGGRILTGVADLDELGDFDASEYEGMRIHVDEMDCDFQSRDLAWKQAGRATFASTAARDSAYAKAAGAYLVAGAEALAGGNPYVRGASVWYPGTPVNPRIRRVGRNSNQSIASGTTALLVQIDATAGLVDLGGIAYAGNPDYALVVPVTGAYRITARAAFAASATGNRSLRWMLNGSDQGSIELVAGAATNTNSFAGSIVELLTAGDKVGLAVWQSSGGALNVTGDLTLELLGAS